MKTDQAEINIKAPETAAELTKTAKSRRKIKTVVKRASVKSAAKKVSKFLGVEKPVGLAPKAKRTFPQYGLEEARRIPDVMKRVNAGNAWAPKEIATALDMSMSSSFFYLTQASRDYGFTIGTRESSKIELTELGRQLVYPKSGKEAAQAIFTGFSTITLFKNVYEYYQGGNLPDIQYLKNTLKTEFGVDEEFQDDFYSIYQKNLTYLKTAASEFVEGKGKYNLASTDHSIIIGEASDPSGLVAFVAMPFSEKTEKYPKGYFDEVLKHLITPAAVKANFNSRTANKAGSEVIQSTIINELDRADLVIVDLTEHNPNVLFELGMRIAFNKPVCLIRAEGTRPIFDVDHMLRVYTYNPNLWASTLATDIPGLTAHILETWKGKNTRSYLDILRQIQPE